MQRLLFILIALSTVSPALAAQAVTVVQPMAQQVQLYADADTVYTPPYTAGTVYAPRPIAPSAQVTVPEPTREQRSNSGVDLRAMNF